MGCKLDSDYTFDFTRHDSAQISSIPDDGLLLSESRAPSYDLSPWIVRLVSFKAETASNALASCSIYSDMAFTIYIFQGRLTAQASGQSQSYENDVVHFGQQSKVMPVSCSDDMIAVGFGLRAGAYHALTGQAADGMVDGVERADIFGLLADDLREIYSEDYSPQQWNLALEEALRRYVARHDPPPPNAVSAAFEQAAFADPMQSLADFAESQNISLRQLQRIVKRDFGLSPRTVMRRARALDLAAQLCGVGDKSEAEEMKLRFFDQSHMNKEFISFFGVTPQRFLARARPLLATVLKQRQARRLDALNRHPPYSLDSCQTRGIADHLCRASIKAAI